MKIANFVLVSLVVISVGVLLMFPETNTVDVYLYRIPYYYLTTGRNKERINHMAHAFPDINITEIRPILTNDKISKWQSGASGFCKMIDEGLRNQDSYKPFQPFVVMEDDASKYREFPKIIHIPKDCDLLYIGVSIFGMPATDSTGNTPSAMPLYLKKKSEGVFRIHNMLGMHGIMVCSAAGANLITRCMVDSYYKDKVWDINMAQTQRLYNVYALDEPLVYQNAKVGGHESGTKTTLSSVRNKIQDDSYTIKKNPQDNLSICTSSRDVPNCKCIS